VRNKSTGEEFVMCWRITKIDSYLLKYTKGFTNQQTFAWECESADIEVYTPEDDNGLYAISDLFPGSPVPRRFFLISI
jgi:hypothetical protein